MAWSIDNIYEVMKWLVRKNQTGLISTTDFFYAWNVEQRSFQQDLVGNWHKTNNSKEGINTGLIQNEIILTKLTPFIINTTLSISSGKSNKPSDLIYTLAIRINGKKVFYVNHDQIYAVNDDVIDPPNISENSYYYSEASTSGIPYYSFLPNTVTEFELDYIGTCPDVVWGFDLDTDGRRVYNSATSVQPLWDQNTLIEITKRSLKSLGVSFKDGDFMQFGQSVTQTGD